MRNSIFSIVLTAAILSLTGCLNISDNPTETVHSVSDIEGTTGSGSPLPHMVFLNGVCMTAANRKATLSSLAADGVIASQVDYDMIPFENEQANFPCVGAPYIRLADGAAAVKLEGAYQLFLADDVVEYQGIYKKKDEVSEDTLKWLNFYHSLSEADRNTISMVPSEFYSDRFGAVPITEETSHSTTYIGALTDSELQETEELAQRYFTEDSPVFEGVDQIYPVDSEEPLYRNAGLEAEYPAGNIIIYRVLTVKDRRDGNPFRTISIARSSKSADWKIINSGY